MSSFMEWINSEEYRNLVEKMEKQRVEYINELENNLSADMISDIRDWRVGEGPDDVNTHSWRGIAALFVEKYPEFSINHNIVSGNQICGMHLCDAVMNLLKQKPEDGWN